MDITINSKTIGAVRFTTRGDYVYATIDGERAQICHGGRLRGYTHMYAGNDASEFRRLCRSWLDQYRKTLDMCR